MTRIRHKTNKRRALKDEWQFYKYRHLLPWHVRTSWPWRWLAAALAPEGRESSAAASTTILEATTTILRIKPRVKAGIKMLGLATMVALRVHRLLVVCRCSMVWLLVLVQCRLGTRWMFAASSHCRGIERTHDVGG
jgi:hypothetical protein